jgi:hypothetical protein
MAGLMMPQDGPANSLTPTDMEKNPEINPQLNMQLKPNDSFGFDLSAINKGNNSIFAGRGLFDSKHFMPMNPLHNKYSYPVPQSPNNILNINYQDSTDSPQKRLRLSKIFQNLPGSQQSGVQTIPDLNNLSAKDPYQPMRSSSKLSDRQAGLQQQGPLIPTLKKQTYKK